MTSPTTARAAQSSGMQENGTIGMVGRMISQSMKNGFQSLQAALMTVISEDPTKREEKLRLLVEARLLPRYQELEECKNKLIEDLSRLQTSQEKLQDELALSKNKIEELMRKNSILTASKKDLQEKLDRSKKVVERFEVQLSSAEKAICDLRDHFEPGAYRQRLSSNA
jgi:chromosome segregation ATPase